MKGSQVTNAVAKPTPHREPRRRWRRPSSDSLLSWSPEGKNAATVRALIGCSLRRW
jgi:hypothetical protein